MGVWRDIGEEKYYKKKVQQLISHVPLQLSLSIILLDFHLTCCQGKKIIICKFKKLETSSKTRNSLLARFLCALIAFAVFLL